MTVSGAVKRDLLRQVELCIARGRLELPISRHGHGTQNMMSLLLAALSRATPKELRPEVSITLIEEPEQNLEPGMQRSIISFIRDNLLGTGENRQCIIATHSPFVLTSTLDLKQVYRLSNGSDGKVTCKDLGTVTEKAFPYIRNIVQSESELFESLFGDLVVVWEGKCEAGLYQAMMRRQKDCPAELLTGVIAAGAGNLLHVAKWFHDAGYTPVVVCDGDSESEKAMKALAERKLSFVALPQGEDHESLVARHLASIPTGQGVEALLRVMGAQGSIAKAGKDAENIKKWPGLAAIFARCEVVSLETGTIVNNMSGVGLPDRDTVVSILRNHKERYRHRILGDILCNIDRLGPFKSIINKLKDVWFDRSTLGCFQLQEDGTIAAYVAARA